MGRADEEVTMDTAPRISTEQVGDATVLHVAGHLDLVTADQFRGPPGPRAVPPRQCRSSTSAASTSSGLPESPGIREQASGDGVGLRVVAADSPCDGR
jgi:hypothetical protein